MDKNLKVEIKILYIVQINVMEKQIKIKLNSSVIIVVKLVVIENPIMN